MEGSESFKVKIAGFLENKSCKIYAFDSLDSTNTFLVNTVEKSELKTSALAIALKQTAGRGRMARKWFSAPYASICLSVAAKLANNASLLESFTVRAGMSVCEALSKTCGARLLVKWPNDIYSPEGKKIAGMLADLRMDKNGDFVVVFGIGLNVDFSRLANVKIPDDISETCADLKSVSDRLPSNAQLCAILADAVIDTANIDKPVDLQSAFAEFDYLKGKKVSIIEGSSSYEGRACGVNARGNLRVELTDSSIREAKSGEATIKKNVEY